MSFSNYGSYISGRRAYRSGESCIAEGPKGEKGDASGVKGDTGSTGPTGPSGPTGKGYTAMGTYTFSMYLTGNSVDDEWDDDGKPPSSGVDWSGFTGSFKDLEFITPGAFCALSFGSPSQLSAYSPFSFPIVDATNTLTGPGTPNRTAHNCLYAYVLPASGQLLGFTVDLVEDATNKTEFYCFIWDPNNTGGGAASFCTQITGPSTPEKFASAYTFEEESKVVCKAGQYLFAVQRVPNGAKKLVHLTAYIRFDD